MGLVFPDTSKPAKMNMDTRRNMSTCGERPDLADREAGLLEQALMKSTKPMAMVRELHKFMNDYKHAVD